MNTADEESRKAEAPSDKASAMESLNTSAKAEDDLKQRIVEIIEFYFSDENILRDSFLLKQVRRNREGYVSLKLIAAFRKVKSLTRNWELLRDALRSSSTQLEVNAEGTKVRRREPLPESDEAAPSRTVVAFSSVEGFTALYVARVFSQCGPISMIRVLPRSGPVPPFAQRFLHVHPELNGCSAAVVEFEHREGARLAMREASPELHVMLVGAASSTGSRDEGGCQQIGVQP